jgi:hypothetical protein
MLAADAELDVGSGVPPLGDRAPDQPTDSVRIDRLEG